jgi:glycerol kinase
VSKQLSLKMIKEENKKYDEIMEFPFERNGEEMIIKIHPYFSPLRIEKLIKEYDEFAKKAEEEKLEISEEDALNLIPCLVIKEFTDINFGTAKKAKSILANFKELTNHPIFKELINAIPDPSMESVYAEFNDRLSIASKVQGLLSRTKEQMEKLESKDILFGDK